MLDFHYIININSEIMHYKIVSMKDSMEEKPDAMSDMVCSGIHSGFKRKVVIATYLAARLTTSKASYSE